MSRISHDSVDTGRKSSIGTTSVQVTTSKLKTISGLQVKASADNAGTVYVGTRSTITANTADTTDGYPLAAGETLLIPARSADEVYAIASEADQVLFWMIA